MSARSSAKSRSHDVSVSMAHVCLAVRVEQLPPGGPSLIFAPTATGSLGGRLRVEIAFRPRQLRRVRRDDVVSWRVRQRRDTVLQFKESCGACGNVCVADGATAAASSGMECGIWVRQQSGAIAGVDAKTITPIAMVTSLSGRRRLRDQSERRCRELQPVRSRVSAGHRL